MLLSAVPGGSRAIGVLHVTVNSLEPRLLLKDPIGNKIITDFMGFKCITNFMDYPVLHIQV